MSFPVLTAVFDGEAQQPTVTTDPSGLGVTLSYSQEGVSVYPINAGIYQVTVELDDEPNFYIERGSATADFVIDPALATVNFTDLTVTYDGEAQEPTVTTIPADLGITLSYSQGGVAVDPINAGNYLVKVELIDEPNYYLEGGFASASFVISPATLHITAVQKAIFFEGDTDLNAVFNFTSVPVAGAYDIVPSKNDDMKNGIDVNDDYHHHHHHYSFHQRHCH